MDRDGNINGVTSWFKSVVGPGRLEEMIEVGKKLGIELHRSLNGYLQDEMQIERV